MFKPVILIIISVLLGVLGQVNLKLGMINVNTRITHNNTLNPPKPNPQFSDKVKKIIYLLFTAFLNPRIIFGILCYVCSMMLWLIVLSRVELSYAYPLLGMSYILVVLSAAVILKEHVSVARWFGTVVIFLGVVLVARS